MTGTQIPTLVCMCSNVRRAARALTQLYQDAMRATGLSSSQFTILQALSRTGEITQGRLGEILAMDSTTLTRTLAIMRRDGWILERRGEDRRERRLRLSKSGEEQLKRALPAWEKAQARVRGRIGDEKWKQLFELTTRLARISVHHGDTEITE
jgi:DNA-binding MarR family transcriptional regulator